MRLSYAVFPILVSTLAVAAACGSSSSSPVLGAAPPESSASSSTSSTSSSSTSSTSSTSSSGSTGDDDDDSGTPPPVDAGPDAAPDTNCVGLAYCDDFESYTPGAIADGSPLGPWIASVTANATMEVNGTMGFQGSKALHVTVPASTGEHGLLNQNNAKGLIAGNNLFGRAMVYYAKANGSDLPLNVHSWLFMGWGDLTKDNKAANINIGGGGTAIQLNYHYASPPAPTGKEASKTGGTITAGAWHCLQWEYDTPNDDTKAFLDGVAVIDVPKSTGWTLPTWVSMDFGFLHYQTLTNAVDVYLDDFAVDKAMIDCPAK